MGSDLKNKFLLQVGTYLWIWKINYMAHMLEEHFNGMYQTIFQINLKVNSELVNYTPKKKF